MGEGYMKNRGKKNKINQIYKCYDLGEKYYKDKEYEKALECFNKVIEYYETLRNESFNNKLININYKYIKSLINMGYILFHVGKYEEALTYFNKVIECCSY